MFDFSIDYTDTGAEPPPLFTSPSKHLSSSKPKALSPVAKRKFANLSNTTRTHQPPSKPPPSKPPPHSIESPPHPPSATLANSVESHAKDKTSVPNTGTTNGAGSIGKKRQKHNHTNPPSDEGPTASVSASASDKTRAIIVRRPHHRRTQAELLAAEWRELPWIKKRYNAGSGQAFGLVDTPNGRRSMRNRRPLAITAA